MLRYFIRRLLIAIPTMWVIVTLAFFMIRLAPGGPFDANRAFPPEVMANLEAMYHLNEPLWLQYLHYLGSILHGDFGPSFVYKTRSVNDLISYGFPISFQLGAWSMLLSILVGSIIGMIAAVKQNTPADYSLMTVSMIGITVPNFVMGPILVLLLAVTWHFLPAGGWGNSWTQQILPVITLALPQIAYIARLMRGSMLEVLHSNYVRTAVAKGLSPVQVVLRHCLKPAIIPVISYLGPACAAVLTGSIVIEQIFSVPGIGRYFVQAALSRDYTLVLGVVIFYGALIVLFNLLVDLAYAWLDPKVRLS